MANNSGLKPLKGLIPSNPKKKHYVFAKDSDDFALFTGSKPFKLNPRYQNDNSKHQFGSISDKYIYVLCLVVDDIKGLTNIEVSITDEFKKSSSSEKLSSLKKEIEICNFQSTQYFNPNHIPNVLKEVMAEQSMFSVEGADIRIKYPVVGMVVKLKRDYPIIEVKRGDYGIIVGLYGLNLECATIIFHNGKHCGFSDEEIREDLQFSHLTDNKNIKEYRFTNTRQLYQDYVEGIFDVLFFYDLE